MSRPVKTVLFVTRRFPPSVGGMETLASDVWQVIEERWPGSHLLSHGGSAARSVLWMPTAVLRAAVLLRQGRIDAVVAGDAVMATALRPVLWLRRRPTVTFVMGLDLTWNKPGYRRLVRWGLKQWNVVAAISSATGAVAAELTRNPDKVQVIRIGVRVPVGEPDPVRAGAAVRARWGIGDDELAVLTLGRVVKRKGAAWFAAEVLGKLPDVRYLVAGVGPDIDAVRAAAASAGVADRLILTGPVTDAEREDLLAGCDLFVQPNIPVPDDMEGFGLVVVEAALRGAPVLASRLEGLRDAIDDGRTGILVNPGDAQAWADQILALGDGADRRALGAQFRRNAMALYGREQMAQRLSDMFEASTRPSAGGGSPGPTPGRR